MIVLYAEDDFDDFEMFEDVLRVINESLIPINVRNGQEVLDFLEVAAILPNIIFLDINMPIMDGRTCLKLIKKNPRFNHIPVVIYSTSNRTQDMELCYELGALAYIQKPFTFKEGVDRLSKFFTR